LIVPEIRLSVTTAVSSGENFYLPICRAFSEVNQMNSRRGILQPLVTQHAKATVCVPQVTAKEANMQKINSKNHALLG